MTLTPRTGVLLSRLTTIGIGGPARYFLEAKNMDELAEAVVWSKTKGLPHLILGGGSNILFPDSGFPGLVIQVEMRGLETGEDDPYVYLRAMAGESWDDLVAHAVSKNWSGIECLSGIPGKVGAAPIQNIGAYGQELSDTLTRVFAFDYHTEKPVTFTKEACGFAYRNSIFKKRGAGKYIVTGIELKLRKSGKPVIRYAELASMVGPEDGLARIRETVLAIRRGKSMVIDPADPNSKSCGSFFLNPVLSQSEYRSFARLAPEDHIRYPAGSQSIDEGPVKLSAAWLIEQSGFHKGYIQGNIGLSVKHCLAIVNRGGGTSAEVRSLVAEIREKVHTRFGVELTPEPVLVQTAPRKNNAY